MTNEGWASVSSVRIPLPVGLGVGSPSLKAGPDAIGATKLY